MEYGRPYRNFQEQVDLLVSRGLDCSDCDAAGALSRLGYYRLSGYTYPFRIPLMPNQQPETPLQFRAPEFQPGYRLTHALDLYNFDHSLRMLCLEALKIVEIGLRVRIAYVLGKRDRFGYLKIGRAHV